MRIVIDGNIGSGKSTQLHMLGDRGYEVFHEQTHKWPLKEFYEDPKSYALPMQLAVLNSMDHARDGVYERSPESSTHVFWKLLVENGTANAVQDTFYTKVYKEKGWGPDFLIYLHTPYNFCWDRINHGQRAQAGDDVITREYLKQIEDKYIDMWENTTCPKVKVDGTQKPAVIHQQICRLISDATLHGNHWKGSKM